MNRYPGFVKEMASRLRQALLLRLGPEHKEARR